MSQVTDLDIVVPDAKTVKFGGELYAVPSDMPMEIFLRVNKAQEGEDMVAQLDGLLDVIVDLFTWELTDAAADIVRPKVREVLMKRGTKYGFGLIRAIYKEDDDAAEAAAQENPTTEPVPSDEDSSGTKSSSTSPSLETPPTVIPAAAVAS